MNKDSRFYKLIKKKINPFRLKLIYNYDFKKFRKYSFELSDKASFNNVKAEITFLYHALEKGMLHENLRLGFGKRKIEKIMDLLTYAKSEDFNLQDSRIKTAIAVLMNYIEIHNNNNYDVSYITDFLSKEGLTSDVNIGGTYIETKESILPYTEIGFKDFAYSRHSVRSFSDKEVAKELIEEAVSIAVKTPSVCNRQAWHLLVVKDNSKIKSVMNIQAGINGMAENLNTLFVISTSNEYFGNIHERNQGYIDGGLFSMSLMYGLHSVGLASCALNANLRVKDELKVKEILGLSNSDNLIMFIAVGHYPDTIKYPKSARDNVFEVITYI